VKRQVWVGKFGTRGDEGNFQLCGESWSMEVHSFFLVQ